MSILTAFDLGAWLSAHSGQIIASLIVAGVVYVLSKSKLLSLIGGIATYFLGVSI